MSGDPTLFGDGDSEQRDELPPRSTTPAADWQVNLLRTALDARGLTTMNERQKAIENAAERAVPSLRDLTNEEALRVLSRLGPTPAPESSTSSAWDERDEDTWIDRL